MSQLREACGAVGPLRLQSEGVPDASLGPRELALPFAVIGRDPKVDLQLDHEGVSRRHAYLQVVAGRIFWCDLGSRLGVSRGGAVGPSGWLGEGESLGVGPCRVLASAGPGPGGDEPPNPLLDPGPRTSPDAVLEFRDRPDAPASWRLGRVLTLVGRGADCRLKIQDEGVSRYHCALLRTPRGPWVVDLLSREGIRVSGVRVRAAPLEDGSSLEVGPRRMIVHLAEPSAPGSGLARRTGLLTPALAGRPAHPGMPARPDPRDPSSASPPGETLIASSPIAMQPVDLERFVGRLELMQAQMFDQFHQAMMTMFQAFGTLQRDQMAQVRDELDRIRDLTAELQSLQAGGPSKAPEEPEAPPPAPSRPADRESVDSPRPRPRSASEEPERYYHELVTRRIAEVQGERQGRWQKVLNLISSGGA